jgi:hypothetical protein
LVVTEDSHLTTHALNIKRTCPHHIHTHHAHTHPIQQYIGSGYGAKDVVYLIVSSVDEGMISDHEADLISHYHSTLTQRLGELGKAAAAREFSLEVLKVHYELAMVDYCRWAALRLWCWEEWVEWCVCTEVAR